MIMLEVFTSYPPYYNTSHDINLITSICNEQKPAIKCKIPQLLKDLMEKCWDCELLNRPTAEKLEAQLNEYYFKGNNELNKQIKDIKESNENFIQFNPDEVHPRTIYKSRPLFVFDRTSNSRQILITLPSSYFAINGNEINKNKEVNENNENININENKKK
ncbi:hypothetical protein Glove_87g179 [Diversispora epigaea]|uniref:Serine-threonine/tyrosine-protein kinase catalytic domain-containing protein n=1 Tax=Diversispora epigaea TaxID=1348612 RepID=A0A397JGN3_9GLOM|nr:hypothetical protein Glove_87g179 [Diversispora epigaea]